MPRVLEPRLDFLNYIQNGKPFADKFVYDPEQTGSEYITQQAYVLDSDKKTLVAATPEMQSAANESEARQSFVRIFNVNKFFPESCAVVTMTPAEYRRMQELGLTLRNDNALTAQIIGKIGQYRLHALRGQEQWGMRNSLMLAKERIAQEAIAQLRSLQIVERAHGRTKAEVLDALETYQQTTKDLKQVQLLITAVNKLSETNFSEQGHDNTRNLVANFVKEQVNRIIREARSANESMTLAGGDVAYFRGNLNRVLAQADQLNVTYLFDQNHAITPEHQGNYKSEYVTVTSTNLVGVGKTQLRDFLFGATYAIADEYDAYKDKIEGIDSIFNRNHFTWLRKLFPARKEATVNSYYRLRDFTKEANPKFYTTVLKDLVSFGKLLWMWLRLTGIAIAQSVMSLFKNFGGDFIWSESKFLKDAQTIAVAE
ncbi:MAG TPA: hypothetical protein VD770_01570, partial [Coxiellaceae bacterium]|nr:hypothetical protein [Coxiellaceae bacterium]